MDAPVAGDEAVAVDDLLIHAEVGGAVPHQLVHFLEGAFVEQQIDALARRQLAFRVLPLHALLAATGFGIGVAAAHFGESVRGHELTV